MTEKMSGRQRATKGSKPKPEKVKRAVDGSGDAGQSNKASDKPVKKCKNHSKDAKASSKTSASSTTNNSFLWGKLIKYVFLVIFIPPFINYTSLQKEGQELKPQEGELYDIGLGQKLFLSCSGKGPPTAEQLVSGQEILEQVLVVLDSDMHSVSKVTSVILDAPTGMSSDVWTYVTPSLAKHAKVCIYDRAGLGFSDRPMNRSGFPKDKEEDKENVDIPSDKWAHFTLERMVDDLHRLITLSSQQPRPLIFVGAELGAIIAQFYTHVYESDVQGVVMVNPLPDNLFEVANGVWADYWFSSLVPSYQSLQLAAATGLSRIGLILGLVKQPIRGQHVSQDVINRQKYLLCNPRHLSSVVDEHYFINETFSQIRTFRQIKRTFPSSVTTTVLTGNYYDEEMPSHLNKAWAQAQQSFLSEHFPRAQHLVVNGADRRMVYKQTDSVVEAVVRIVKRWKRSM